MIFRLPVQWAPHTTCLSFPPGNPDLSPCLHPMMLHCIQKLILDVAKGKKIIAFFINSLVDSYPPTCQASLLPLEGAEDSVLNWRHVSSSSVPQPSAPKCWPDAAEFVSPPSDSLWICGRQKKSTNIWSLTRLTTFTILSRKLKVTFRECIDNFFFFPCRFAFGETSSDVQSGTADEAPVILISKNKTMQSKIDASNEESPLELSIDCFYYW